MKAREYAWSVLDRIINQHGYANLILRSRKEAFSAEDIRLINEIVYGTLRNLTFLEYQWKDLARGRVKQKTAVLINMSVYQLLYLDRIPAYAVINEAVELSGRGEKGFVNAVLHKVQKRGMKMPVTTDPLEKAALQYSHPLWLLKMWASHYGLENALKTAEKDQERAIVYGRVNTLKTDPEVFFRQPKVTHTEDLCFTYDGILSETDWFRNGEVIIQDRMSQRVVSMLDAGSGMNVMDCCAAPGTKTQQICAAMKNKGTIYAYDLYPERVKLIEELMKRTGSLIVKAAAGDASKPADLPDESMDRILIDAPCSGLGDLSHKPEIRYHIRPEDIDELVRTQKSILEASCRYLKKGGILVYSTCTLNRKENENQIAAFLKEHDDFELCEEHTWFPFEFESDGFYCARLMKK